MEMRMHHLFLLLPELLLLEANTLVGKILWKHGGFTRKLKDIREKNAIE